MTGSPWSEPGALRVGNNDALDLLTKACDLCLDVRTANSRVLQQSSDEHGSLDPWKSGRMCAATGRLPSPPFSRRSRAPQHTTTPLGRLPPGQRRRNAGWPSGTEPARRELEGIYLRKTAYGSGAGQLLLDAIVADAPAYLWMLDDNPRNNRNKRTRSGSLRPSDTNDGVAGRIPRAGVRAWIRPSHCLRFAPRMSRCSRRGPTTRSSARTRDGSHRVHQCATSGSVSCNIRPNG